MLTLAAPALDAQSPSSPSAHGPVLQIPAGQDSAKQGSGQPTSEQQSPAPAAEAAAHPSREVKLTVFVHDKKGHPAANLSKQDFVLEQDGHPQTIAQVADQSSTPLTLGVVADTAAEQRKALAGERKTSTEFLKRLLRKGTDRGFVVHFDREVEMLQDVTGSQDKLAKGIDEISAGEAKSAAPHGPPPRRGGNEPEPGRRHFSFGGEVLYDAIFLSADEVLKGQPGRKAIVLFSNGVDRSSKKTLPQAIEAAQRAGVLVYCVYVPSERSDEERRDEVGSSRGPYPGGGYPPGYPGGGYPPGYPGGGYPYPGGSPWPRRREPESAPKEDKGAAKKTLQQIALETGGRYFELSKKRSAEQIYAQVEEEMRHQYGLSYTPDEAASGYHKLHVSTRNPELTAQTPAGFYAE